MTTRRVAVTGGEIVVEEIGSGDTTIVALHGITGNRTGWRPLARRLHDTHTILAVDLRGRGESSGVGPPYGLARHVDDVVAIVAASGASRTVLVGHSLGAMIARHAAPHLDCVVGLVLVDGGVPLPRPAGSLRAAVDALLGPSLARLERTFPNPAAYLDFWRSHPAFRDTWGSDVSDYFLHDLCDEPPPLRSRVDRDAVIADAGALYDNAPDIDLPGIVLHAEYGVMTEEPLFPAALVDASVAGWRLRPRLVRGVNHYSILFDPAGVDAVAAAVEEIDCRV